MSCIEPLSLTTTLLPKMDTLLEVELAWLHTYIPGNVGVSSMSQEKVHNGGVALLTGHTEWRSSFL